MGRAACISCWWTIVRRKAPRGAASSPAGDEDLWQALAATAKREAIYLDQRFSDHAPLTIDYDFTL